MATMKFYKEKVRGNKNAKLIDSIDIEIKKAMKEFNFVNDKFRDKVNTQAVINYIMAKEDTFMINKCVVEHEEDEPDYVINNPNFMGWME